ncbi:VOC family protein [Streptomyces sp. NPDC058382]|uniref:VOC family protein n=1 Tax=unclassified Streptomyces TaxID=2593676 RepID=UPI0036383470
MSPPALSGLHHVTLPVSDLKAGAAWYATVLTGERMPALDHHDSAGGHVSAVLTVPGPGVPVQLRLAPDATATAGGYAALTLAVRDRSVLDQWAAHLDTAGITHGRVTEARDALGFHDPDGTLLRLRTEPVGGLTTPTPTVGGSL